ncbi:putative MFS transporter [Actinoplanes missouriensis 431]|uniref:Putative MFS transporter n=2 Tax=Actinoplanes missouriensis TaxID=1866 RepID=I0H5K5_ACTM4|nr:putative MFS transporter [Actinoplanes missouriensis 431]
MMVTRGGEVTMRTEQRAGPILAIATAGYLLSAWAWALLAPLAPLLRDTLGLTAIQQAAAVSIPVVVGSLGRVPVGALTDRLGARTAFLLVAAATVAALLVLTVVVEHSAAGLLIGAGLLGVAGTMFAVAVPVVSSRFAAPRRGLALGVLGTGLCGGAIGGLTTVRLVEQHGIGAPFLAAAAGVALFAVLVVMTVPDTPRRPSTGGRPGGALVAVLRLPITRRGALWNAVTSALFVTFSSYLPVYLTNAYGLPLDRTGYAMAGFIVLAVLMRPVGGWLADRLAPRRPLTTALVVLAAAVTAQAFTPPLPLVVTLLLPVIAVALGIASGALLAQVAAVAPPAMIGRVSGMVTGVAGLAGFASPLLMASSVNHTTGYGPALGVLAAATAVAAISALTGSGHGSPR